MTEIKILRKTQSQITDIAAHNAEKICEIFVESCDNEDVNDAVKIIALSATASCEASLSLIKEMILYYDLDEKQIMKIIRTAWISLSKKMNKSMLK